MFDNPFRQVTAVHRFVQENYEGLQSASLLLGGRPWLQRVQRAVDDLAMNPTLSRRMQREIEALHDLLALTHVDDESRPEAAYFSVLDPAQPYVEDICLLADGLADALQSHDAEVQYKKCMDWPQSQVRAQ